MMILLMILCIWWYAYDVMICSSTFWKITEFRAVLLYDLILGRLSPSFQMTLLSSWILKFIQKTIRQFWQTPSKKTGAGFWVFNPLMSLCITIALLKFINRILPRYKRFYTWLCSLYNFYLQINVMQLFQLYA